MIFTVTRLLHPSSLWSISTGVLARLYYGYVMLVRTYCTSPSYIDLALNWRR